jgi:hypothetical protein
MSPKRAWRKKLIIEWLKRHYVSVPTKTTKVELLELAFDNLPRKRHVVDEAAAKRDIDILRLVFALSNIYLLYKNVFRLSVNHCMSNPIELA